MTAKKTVNPAPAVRFPIRDNHWQPKKMFRMFLLSLKSHKMLETTVGAASAIRRTRYQMLIGKTLVATVAIKPRFTLELKHATIRGK